MPTISTKYIHSFVVVLFSVCCGYLSWIWPSVRIGLTLWFHVQYAILLLMVQQIHDGKFNVTYLLTTYSYIFWKIHHRLAISFNTNLSQIWLIVSRCYVILTFGVIAQNSFPRLPTSKAIHHLCPTLCLQWYNHIWRLKVFYAVYPGMFYRC